MCSGGGRQHREVLEFDSFSVCIRTCIYFNPSLGVVVMSGENPKDIIWIANIVLVFPAAEDVEHLIPLVVAPPHCTETVPSIVLKDQHAEIAITYIVSQAIFQPSELILVYVVGVFPVIRACPQAERHKNILSPAPDEICLISAIICRINDIRVLV